MIKKIIPIKKEIKIDNLSEAELKDLVVKIATKLSLEIKEK
jgi:hypothetical protein